MSTRIALLRRRPDPGLVDRLEQLIGEVVRGLEEGEDCRSLVAEINALTGQDYEPGFFFELYGWTDERTAAEAAAMGVPSPISDLSREEVSEVIGILGEGNEPESTYFLDWLERCFPACRVSDLIFSPYKNLIDDEIAAEILLRRDLSLSGGPSAVRTREIELAQEVMRNPEAAAWSLEWAEVILGTESRGERDRD
jgi:hypothetical protein